MNEQDRKTRVITTRLNLLRRAIDIYNDQVYWPREGKSFCNTALCAWMEAWTARQFKGLLANEISANITTSSEWAQLSASEAMHYAHECYLVVAHKTGAPHGHVAAVLPMGFKLPRVESWEDVPVLSMGKTPRIAGRAAECFKGRPTFSVWNTPVGPFPWGN